jgi:biopolymer transport protein ExbD
MCCRLIEQCLIKVFMALSPFAKPQINSAQSMPTGDDPALSNPAQDSEQQPEAPEFAITIEVYSDGTVKVGQEAEETAGSENTEVTDQTAMSQESMTSDDDSGMQTVDSIDAALKVAKMKLEEHMSGGVSPFDVGMAKGGLQVQGVTKKTPKLGMPSGYNE